MNIIETKTVSDLHKMFKQKVDDTPTSGNNFKPSILVDCFYYFLYDPIQRHYPKQPIPLSAGGWAVCLAVIQDATSEKSKEVIP